jgi:hypothetical protein
MLVRIPELIDLVREKGSQLAKSVAVEGMPDMVFACSLSDEGVDTPPLAELHAVIPDELVTFWRIARCARLFEDKVYGQWGLEILDPDTALIATRKLRDRRFRDYVSGDLVMGRFIGDSDLLLIRCDPNSTDFGNLLVTNAIDPRHDWYRVAVTLSEFLEAYIKAGGDKTWTKASP